ncbi:hypothetical protein AYO21_06055 [Fonsecaea monophora]|uniref:Cytochrome P450 oxidoreductase n=1 Tax=Fonsecaea monophora TaxID=254056 RepID=A0A177F869_9EURO|nr:hypothetical protein AYO21_06055 [Fonsecaea monophora]KAH0832551.1 Pisatin demethylase [Fonsecaea pedrosoi]OAG39780.1 hypothetical protein AYO21_06055 [Fonsecaea monophora]
MEIRKTGLILCVVAAIYTIVWLYRKVTSPEWSIPGPWLARFSRIWYFWHVRAGSFHHENIELHRKYGPIVRVGPNLYSIAAPDKEVYGIGSKFRKSDWYEGWKHPSPDKWALFADRDIRRHAETRKRFQGLYSMSALLSYEKYVDDCTAIFDQRLTEFERSGEQVDMAHWFQCYAFDVMGNLTYSERFGFLDRGDDIAGTIAALEKSGVYSTLIGIYAWLHPFVYRVMEFLPNNGASGRTYLMNFVQQKIDAREKERTAEGTKPTTTTAKHIQQSQLAQEQQEQTPRDFLDKLRDGHLENPQQVTRYHMFMMGLSNIIAGSDTTAVSLSSVLFHLLTNPRTLEKLQREIAEYRKSRTSVQEDGDAPTLPFKVTQDLPYLQAVIKEALRMHPATGLPLWRVVPAGGATVLGHYFPAGAIVGVNSWVAHRNEEVFGNDVGQFRPERWIEAKEGGDVERLKRMEAFYMPFGLGSRTCLGRHISTLEMSKLVPRLVEHYDFELAMDPADWRTVNYWFVRPERFPVLVKRRASVGAS